ncbi:MAG TPA: Fic family protein [Actinomycetota bacterium]|nr:Fic family protein [Actinomycetota bacterium]
MPRAYETSHPWLKFKVDIRSAGGRLWMLLGEATSKVEHIRGVPLRPAVAEELHRVYLAKGAWATTSIEGNTLTEEQVRAIVETGDLDLPRSQEYLEVEVQNMIGAFNSIADDLKVNGPSDPTLETISEWNRVVLKGLELPPEVVPGELRMHSVIAGPYRGAPAEDLDYLMRRMLDWLRDEFAPPEDQPDVHLTYVILKAICAHLYFELIHPFGDGNGRTGRLLEFQILLSNGVPFPAAHLLSNHYNLTRSRYYQRLAGVSRNGGDLVEFIEYATEGFVDGLRAQIARIQEAQLDVAWENYIYEVVDSLPSELGHRLAKVVLAMSRYQEGTAFRLSELPDLSPELGETYARMTEKTVRRDARRLIELDLLERTQEGGLVVAKHRMRAFLPDSIVIDPQIIRQE